MDAIYYVGEIGQFVKIRIGIDAIVVAAGDGRIQNDGSLGVCIHSSDFMVGYYDTKIRTMQDIGNY